jgi:hypothetical protein
MPRKSTAAGQLLPDRLREDRTLNNHYQTCLQTLLPFQHLNLDHPPAK